MTRIKVFETNDNSNGQNALNEFLSSGITVLNIFTAAAGGGNKYTWSIKHFVTVVYTENETNEG